ncbi:MAG TPA: hypothetical protein DEQ34_03280 [Balneolaceae bacterium]|nr:hypothetical protein [Balneolaceae bacterium]|tara:strand:+ start:31696 stop:32790 length:1095 start_codon:yes stop_codon:yes gene_type:complete
MKTYDFGILGAGIAGMSLAKELKASGAKVFLADTKKVGSGGSGAPMGLVNPATGRYATYTWRADEGYEAVKNNLEVVHQYTGKNFYKINGVLRPAMDARIASRMKENVEHPNWPDGWIEWKTEQEVQTLHPGITCVEGGVWLPQAITVDMGGFIDAFSHYNTSLGIDVFTHIRSEVQETGSDYLITLEDGEQIAAKNLIYTSGYYLLLTDFWNTLPLVPVKGQLAIMRYLKAENLPFSHSISALGYTTTLGGNEFVVGSTYEHSFEHEDPDPKGLDYLMSRFGKVLPDIKTHSEVIGRWSGMRASTPNRKPIMGKHPGKENLYVFAGLGSKGLLYGGMLAKDLTDHMLDNTPLHPDIDIQRLFT